jgi:molecular chaperone DnaJ
VDSGTRLRISGEGEAGINGGPSGDLFLVIDVAEHPDFKRDGADLHRKLSVTFPQVALGCTVSVPTLTGEPELLEIPAGTQSGKVFRIKGKGITRLRGARGTGDLFVHLSVDVPTKLTEKQRALLEALAKEMNVEVADQGLFAKFRTLFGG